MLGAALLLALAACGGGSGSTTPGPNPRPSPGGSSRPAQNGDTFHYTGTLAETFWRPAQPGPSNAPSPVPTSTTNWTVDNVTTVKTNTTFHGATGLTNFAQDEADTGLQTITTVTNDYFLFPAGGAGPLIENGYESLDSNFVLNDVQHGAGNGVVDMLPETGGSTWTNNARLTSSETDPDGQTSNRRVNDDGSYSETDSFPDGTLSSANSNPDSSGVYKVLKGTPIETDYTYAAPAGGHITITVTEPGASPQPTPIVFIVPDWLPAGGLASDAYIDDSNVTIPAACALPTKFGTQGDDIVENRTAVDPIFGTVDTIGMHTYVVQGRGVVCVTRVDELTAFYDFSGQNGLAFFSGKPIQFTVIDETIGLQAETVLASGVRRPALLAARGAARLVNAIRMRAAQTMQTSVRRAHASHARPISARSNARRTQPS